MSSYFKLFPVHHGFSETLAELLRILKAVQQKDEPKWFLLNLRKAVIICQFFLNLNNL